jgi:hypothetical protein
MLSALVRLVDVLQQGALDHCPYGIIRNYISLGFYHVKQVFNVKLLSLLPDGRISRPNSSKQVPKKCFFAGKN